MVTLVGGSLLLFCLHLSGGTRGWDGGGGPGPGGGSINQVGRGRHLRISYGTQDDMRTSWLELPRGASHFEETGGQSQLPAGSVL